MNDGLKETHRRSMIDLLAANPRVERVVLFGSRAMGTFTPASDVDLALFGEQITLDDQARLTEAISEQTIPQRVDLLLHHRIKNKKLLDHIQQHGIEWYPRLLAELEEQFAEGERLTKVVREKLGGLANGG